MIYLHCAGCGLTLARRGGAASLQYCPRCIARRGVAVELRTAAKTHANRLPPGQLAITATAHEGRHHLALAGELDLATAGKLEAVISELCADSATEVVLDLDRVSFVDCTGLRTILTARSICRQHGCRFLVTRPQERVERLFELTGLRQTLLSADETDARLRLTKAA